MEKNDLRDLESIFAQVEDPRRERTKLHRLGDIIILAMCGVLCGADGWVEIEEFGKAKEAFFTDLLTSPNGIPSHDTFGRDLHPNLWRPQRGGLTHQLFVLKWTHVAECRMSPRAIIKGFNVIKGGAPGLCSCRKWLTINAFTLETVKKVK